MSENVNHYLVYSVDNDMISIGALNTDDSEAIECYESKSSTAGVP